MPVAQPGIQTSGRYPGRLRFPVGSSIRILEMGCYTERSVVPYVPLALVCWRKLTDLGTFFTPVWKREKDLLYLGSFHGGDLPEMYGFIGDHQVGTDAIGTCPSSS